MKTENVFPPLQKLNSILLEEKGVELHVLRLDLNHPHISGNKLYKLKYNIQAAKESNKKILLTFGGAFSNHIAATAAAGKENNLQTIGIIRGEEAPGSNPTLQFARSCGMQLHFVSRTMYQDKAALKNFVAQSFPESDVYIIPEGGSNHFGVKGCKEIMNDLPADPDFICCPCGTGTTLSGIILSLKPHQYAIGFQVLKGEQYIENEVRAWLDHFGSYEKSWEINDDFHFGGYAKLTPGLLDFMFEFEKANDIPLDYIYTGKMMYGIMQLIREGRFKKGCRIVALHTGGLQGNKGFEN